MAGADKRPGVKTVYPSRVDWWLMGPVVFAPVLVALSYVGTPFSWMALGGGVLMAAIIGVLLIPCHYTLTEDAILIRCGFFYRQRIALKDVRNIELSNCPLSAPALSLRRIKIETTNSIQLISPKDREGFIAAVEARIPLRRPAGN